MQSVSQCFCCNFFTVNFICFAATSTYYVMCVSILNHFFCRCEQKQKTRRIIQRKPRPSSICSCRTFGPFRFFFYAKFAQCMPPPLIIISLEHADYLLHDSAYASFSRTCTTFLNEQYLSTLIKQIMVCRIHL